MSNGQIKYQVCWECGDPSADVIVKVYAPSKQQAVAKAMQLLKEAVEYCDLQLIEEEDEHGRDWPS